MGPGAAISFILFVDHHRARRAAALVLRERDDERRRAGSSQPGRSADQTGGASTSPATGGSGQARWSAHRVLIVCLVLSLAAGLRLPVPDPAGDLVQDRRRTRRAPALADPATWTTRRLPRISARHGLPALAGQLASSSRCSSPSAGCSSTRWPATRWPGCASAAAARCSAAILAVMAVPGVVLLIPKFLVLNAAGHVQHLHRHDPAAAGGRRRGLHHEAVLRVDPARDGGGGPHRRRRRSSGPTGRWCCRWPGRR